MQSNQPYFLQQPMTPLTDQEAYYMQNPHVAPFFNGPTFDNVDIKPSDACPRNFIIFDKSNNRSHVMFHPEISSKLFRTGLNVHAPVFQNEQIANDEREVVSSFKEDSADIDALLSTEIGESEERHHYDDDVVSTARTNGCNYSPESCSNYVSSSKCSRSYFKKSFGNSCDDKKRNRVRKMVKVLRGIVPRSNRMSSVAVLDEAIRNLKSLRVALKVQKLGVGSTEG